MNIKKLAIYGLAMVLLGSVAACGSSSSTTTTTDDVGEGTGDAVTDTSTSIQSALTTAGTAMGTAYSQALASSTPAPGGLIKAVALETVTVTCTPSGSATVGGDYDATDDSFSFTFDMSFDDCDGLNGDLTMEGDISVTDTELDYAFAIDGDVAGNGCSTTFDAFTYDFSLDLTGLEEGEFTFTGTIDGVVSATCDGTTVTCTYDNESFEDLSTMEFDDNCVES